MDDVPFEALGGVDRAEHEVVVVEVRWAGEVGARLRRVEDEVGDELPQLAAVLARGRDELLEVAQADRPSG